MSALVRLEWERDPAGYEIVEGEPRLRAGAFLEDDEGAPESSLIIRPRGRRRQKYTLEGTANRVSVELANTPPTKEGVLAFANKWGLLRPKHDDQGFDDFCWIIKNQKKAADLACEHSLDTLQRLLKARGVPLRLRIGRLTGDSASRLLLDAENLVGFCHAEFMQLLAGGVEVRKCRRCGTIMALGKVGQQPSYCSDACRVAMHRRKKRDKVLRLASAASRLAARA